MFPSTPTFDMTFDPSPPTQAGVGGAGEAALGEGEEPAEGQHRGEQGEDDEAGGLLDRGADPLPHGQRAPEGGPGAVPDPGEEVQQGQEAHQGLPAKVSGGREAILFVLVFRILTAGCCFCVMTWE